MTVPYKKKLIEVALPLEAINVASAREKQPGIGAHPRGLHQWWARRPLAAARAVIFAQMVDDPSSNPDLFPTEKAQEKERQRLFKIIEELVLWENTTNEEVLEKARAEIWQSWRRACAENVEHPQAKELFDRKKLPAFHDPFAGGGALPLEAQRLGLEAYASDLNPVAVLINKAMIEIPPKFAGKPPVNPEARKKQELFQGWNGAQGLAEDVRYYGQWMRDEAEKRIGHLYPKVEITKDMVKERPDLKPYVGRQLTVIAWLWARTVKSPNPAFSQVDVPLISTFMLSTKAGKEAYVEPVIENGGYRFTVKVGKPIDAEAAKSGTTAGKRNAFRCLMSDVPVTYDHIRHEGQAGKMGVKLMAIVAEGERGRVYLPPMPEQEAIAGQAKPEWKPDNALPVNPRDFKTPNYGLNTFGDLFTPRQLVALTTFSDLVQEARELVKQDALGARTSPTPALPRWGREDISPQRGEIQRGASWQPTPVPSALLSAARELRKNMTHAEKLLWQCLRQKQLDDFRFRKQHPIERFVLDFYCPAAKLAIELDGGQHNTEEGIQKDRERTKWLEQQGIRVLRFWNNEVFENIDGVLTRIWDALHEHPHSFPHPNPPPLGEGAILPPTGGDTEEGDGIPLADGGTGAQAYADAVAVYLGFAVDKGANYWSSLCSWHGGRDTVTSTFGRQAIPMVWDFAEANPFSDSSGNILLGVEQAAKMIQALGIGLVGLATQVDASVQTRSKNKLVSTDPPYYDNIGYADLSDFFYVWLRRSLKSVFPNLFATLAVPKAEELVATPYRHGSNEKAETFFLDGMTKAIHRLAEQAHPVFPVTIYYAFKQSETESDGTSSTGWETFLDAVIQAGFALTGTWPMRTEYTGNLKKNFNALASSIVLVCRKRAEDAPTATRREFINELKAELPVALAHLQRGNIAPVDLAQASIGPGMAVYTRYSKVLDAEGKPLSVRDALTLINQTLDETLAEQEGDFDSDTRWALSWFEQFGFSEGEYGVAETLSKAKNTSVSGLVEAGIVFSKAGKVQLLKPEELPSDWDPLKDTRLTVWEVSLHLIRALQEQGEAAAAKIRAQVGAHAGAARELAYRQYTVCERKKWSQDALAFNSLVISWPEIERLARETVRPKAEQQSMFDEEG